MAPQSPGCLEVVSRHWKTAGKYPEAGGTSRSHFKAKDMGLWDALRPELKGQEGKATQRPELNQQHPHTHTAATSGSRKTLLLQEQEEKLSPSVCKVKVRQYREK